jgi:hypothetical protein
VKKLLNPIDNERLEYNAGFYKKLLFSKKIIIFSCWVILGNIQKIAPKFQNSSHYQPVLDEDFCKLFNLS